MSKQYYKGYFVYYYPEGSQHWRAERHGVGICANTYEAICRMIDQRVYESQEGFRHV